MTPRIPGFEYQRIDVGDAVLNVAIGGAGPPVVRLHALLDRLGHDSFALVGHDRGALVAFRAALDRPEREQPAEVAAAVRELLR